MEEMQKRGGARPGAGRKKQGDTVRERRTMRALEDEWNIINRFGALVKNGYKEECLRFVEELEKNNTR